MLTRRTILKGLGAFAGTSAGCGGYAVAEPFRLNVTRYRLTPPGWPASLRLTLAALADIHACEPWMGADHIRQIVAETNALKPDAVLLLGDYVAGDRLSHYASDMPAEAWAGALADLNAPLGVHAVLGNHDWWDDPPAQRRRYGPTEAGRALGAVGIPVYENQAVRLEKGESPFWLLGLGDQWAFWALRSEHLYRGWSQHNPPGIDDLPGTLAQVTDDAPVILMAHEPDIFPEVPDRVAVTIAGHTHGGQVQLLGFAPFVPSRFGARYRYGHIVEQGRNLIVSGGLGCSGLPVRFGVPPEIVMIELGTSAA